jgi:hypothetical protein
MFYIFPSHVFPSLANDIHIIGLPSIIHFDFNHLFLVGFNGAHGLAL